MQKQPVYFKIRGGSVIWTTFQSDLAALNSRGLPSHMSYPNLFLDLPAEIRHKIYEYGLGGKNIEILPAEVLDHCYSISAFSSLAVGLLQTNRQISWEAAPYLYGANRFYFTGEYAWQTLDAWLRQIGATNRDLLTDLGMDEISEDRLDNGQLRQFIKSMYSDSSN
jgi:hypothetical protein